MFIVQYGLRSVIAMAISREGYDRWRYYYPEFDKSQKIAEVMSQELSDIFKDIYDSDRR